MIAPVCDNCGNELKEFGGILFGPPDETIMYKGLIPMTPKFHLCVSCFNMIETIILNNKKNVKDSTK
jgi:hypothetical protein